MFTIYFQNKLKTYFYSKITSEHSTFQTKKSVGKFSYFSFFTLYWMRGAVIGRNFTPIREHSITVKNQRKWVMVFHCVGAKGLTKIRYTVNPTGSKRGLFYLTLPNINTTVGWEPLYAGWAKKYVMYVYFQTNCFQIGYQGEIMQQIICEWVLLVGNIVWLHYT